MTSSDIGFPSYTYQVNLKGLIGAPRWLISRRFLRSIMYELGLLGQTATTWQDRRLGDALRIAIIEVLFSIKRETANVPFDTSIGDRNFVARANDPGFNLF